MDKTRDADRGEKNRGAPYPPGLDPATAALYASLFAGGGLGAYAAAAGLTGLGSLSGLSGSAGFQTGYPPSSSAAGLASFAAAQQAQQAAALASLGPSAAAWWNLAGLQQMELLSRLQGGLGGSAASLGAYPGLHPEHLMNLELLQAQHAAAMAAALSATKTPSSRSSSSAKLTSSSSSSSQGRGISSSLNTRTTVTSTTTTSSSYSSSRSRDLSSSSSRGASSSSSSLLSRSDLDITRLVASAHGNHSISSSSRSSNSHLSSNHLYSSSLFGLDSALASRPDLGSSHSLSYGIASLMADKVPHSSKTAAAPTPPSQSERVAERLASNGSVSISKAIRNKELEIIPISPASKNSSDGRNKSKDRARERSSTPQANFQKEKLEPKVLISAVSGASAGLPLSNGISSSSPWKEEAASVSIEPCNSAGVAGEDDAPLNLSLKSSSSSPTQALALEKLDREREHDRKESTASLFTEHQSSDLSLSSLTSASLTTGMPPGYDVLQNLYSQPGEQHNVLASMQEALQRQLLAVDEKKREDKKKRMEEAQERARHLGRGVSKPKKNTVASLLEHCRAAGIKPQLPLPATISPSPMTSTSPLAASEAISGSNGLPLMPSSFAQSLPSSLIHPSLPVSLSASVGSSGSSSLASTPPTPSVSISAIGRSTPPSTPATPSVPTSESNDAQISVSLPSSISVSSCVSITTTSSSINVKPQVTIQPVSSVPDNSEKETSIIENKVEIMPISKVQENGDKHTKKRHMVTSSSVDGRLVTTIKAASSANDSSGISDSDSDESSVSSVDEETLSSLPSPWLKRDSGDTRSQGTGSPPVKKRKMITDEASLREPLCHGWRRETTMRGVTQSGVRGEVVYYAPCGKAFRQYPDIIRYIERNSISEVSRDNFSFSSKITIGDYVDATTHQKYSESEVRELIQEIRSKRGHKPQLKKIEREGRDALEVEAEVILRRLEAEEQAQKVRQEFLSRVEEQRQLNKLLREQEKVRKQEETKKEKEDMKKHREEASKQKLFEQVKKAQDREREKQKQKILKEQLYLQELNKQRDMLYTLELERERRRYHGVLVRSLESRKRYEEREKRRMEQREEKRATKERKREERQVARELNQLLKEVKEDMELTDHHPLPKLLRLHGLRVSPEAFGNVLMIFEFLHTFGETLGFDMESLPSLQSLQFAFLNDQESEEELLNVLSHLLVCVIEDPGIPSSQKHTTILGQTLNRADITHTNISDILRVYLHANATGEVRIIHGLHGTEKERRENPKKAVEWEEKVEDTETFKMSQWLQALPFHALNSTQKSEIVAYVCTELLQNKAVIKQIEDSLDRHNALKTEKWKLDTRIRKLRMRVARKRIYSNAMRSLMETKGEDSNLSTASGVSATHWDLEKMGDKRDDKLVKEEEEDEEDDDHDNDSANDSDAREAMDEIPDEEEDKNLNTEDATKTLELLQRQMNQVRQELFETAQQVRGYNCGQDRYQRTMWVLPHAGGPFLEGLNSCDYTGRLHFPAAIPVAKEKVGLTSEDVNILFEKEKVEIKTELQTLEQNNSGLNLVNGDKKIVELKTEEPIDDQIMHTDIKKENDVSDIPDIPKHSDVEFQTPKKEDKENINTSNIEDCSKLNGKMTDIGMVFINGLKEPNFPHGHEGVDKDLVATGLGLIPGQYLRPEHVAQVEKLTFSLLPRTPCDASSLEIHSSFQTPQGTPRASWTDSPFSRASCPQSPAVGILPSGLTSMTHKELLEKLHQSAEALPIPPEFKTGWWCFEDLNQLKEMINSLNERGVRERELKRFIEKNLSIIKNAVSKVSEDQTKIEPINYEEEEVFYDEYGTPIADNPENWSPEVALKIDLQSLEAVFAMEEKITNASMQSKTWRLADNGERTTADYRPSCLSPTDENDKRLNPVHVGRQRLLSLEEGIERRYLKPPLGIPVNLKNDTIVELKVDTPRSLLIWRDAVANCKTAAQLAMCTYMLETAVAWDKSIMKAYCQFCHSGDFEEKLLLCDGCDKGYHTICFKPPMENIPEGDWYCFECVNKFSDTSQRHCLVCGGTEGRNLVHCTSCPRAYHTTCINPPLSKVPRNKWNCPACTIKSPRGRRGRTKKLTETESSPPSNPPPPTQDIVEELPSSLPSTPTSSTPKKERIKKKEQKELSICRSILTELEEHEDAWPFLLPVNTRQFPTYKKIINKPMDLSTIKKKLEENNGGYKSKEEYCDDIRLMFNNCETFNEDDSPVGKAGHNLRSFFESKWNELFPVVQ